MEYDSKQNYRVEHFFLLNPLIVTLLLSTISVIGAK